ncbi:choice-of-anchor B family protein [Fodinibius sp.]|uniref:choice-of-anchor B family protein n=1 Tax=Fodinibius sp. TaxID=1872440 RepID=UPI002ACE17AF|nr:choice-of-anchor B family protein [Fodinibius sp.]MDZ7659858.1 choice-of-anchor B family protein [Fodinibius sp.]
MKLPFYSLWFIVAILVVGCSDNSTNVGDPIDAIDIPAELECVDGLSNDRYGCNNIDLVATVSPENLLAEPLDDGQALNDIWGWTDPETGTEYALVGLVGGVAFVDLSTPSEPQVVGKLEEPESVSGTSGKTGRGAELMHEEKSSWRDFKVYQNYLYVVSDAQPHGMQVFDLSRLRGVENPPVIFEEDYHYKGFENAHNIAINKETGYGYVGGSDTYGGGLHIVDLRNPLEPQFAGFHSDSTVGFDSTGYVHDTQCVVYDGPDADYQGDEICMNSSETHLVIANVTDKEKTETIAKSDYQNNGYAHQGWLTEDHRYFLLDDEFDEAQNGINTQTYIWDVQDLDNPELIGVHEANTPSIDHNQYIKGNYTYQANYTAGLRILSLENIEDGELEEVAYFDTFPDNDNKIFDGAWSNYPFFESGIIIVSDITNGLFILHPTL